MNHYRGISKREALHDVCRLDQTWDEPPVDECEDEDDPQEPEGTTLGPTTARADVAICRLCGQTIGQDLLDICDACQHEHDARYLAWLNEQEFAWLREQGRVS